MSRRTDEAFEAILWAAAKGSDEGVDAAISGAVKSFDPTSFMKKMTSADFFRNISIPKIDMSTSKLFHLPDNLKSLTKVELDALVPDTTTDLIESLSRNADNVTTSTIDDFVAGVDDVGVDPDDVKLMAKNTSLTSYKNTVDDFAESAAKNGDYAWEAGENSSSILNRTENTVDSTTTTASKTSKTSSNFDNTDDMADAFRKSGDDVVDGVVDSARKNDGVVDDLAEEAASRWDDIAEKIGKIDGPLNAAVLAGYFFGLHVNGNAPWSESEYSQYFGDPITESEVEGIIEYSIDTEGIIASQGSKEDEDGIAIAGIADVIESDSLALAVIAASIAFLAL